MIRSSTTAALILVTAGAIVAFRAEPGAQTQRPTFRGGVELVDVDVVVFDKTTGKPIRGLKQSDFSIVDHKTPQAIATFSEINYDHDPNEPSLPPSVPLDVSDNRSAQSTRLVLIVVDDLHIAQSLTERTKSLVREMLRDLGPFATVGLAFSSGKAGVEMTEDRALVYRQIEAFKGLQALRSGGAMPSLGGDSPGRPMPGSKEPAPGGAAQKVKQPKSELSSEDYWSANALHNTLAEDAKMLGTETLRRKAFVLVSEGVPTDVQGVFDTMQPRPSMEVTSANAGPLRGEPPGFRMDSDLVHAMDMMRRANVALYAIDPGAGIPAPRFTSTADASLMASQPIDVTSGRPSLSVLRGWDGSPQSMSANYLTALADFSGGFAITAGDSLDSGLQTLLGDLDHYYMLGFVPASNDTKWHDIDVTVDVPNVIVRSRRGYRLGSETPPPENKKEPLAGFAATVLPATDLPLKMFATPLPSVGQKQTRMAITMQIHGDRDAMRDADGELRDTLHMLTMAVDLKTRKLTKTIIKRERFVSLKPADGVALPSDVVYQIVSEWELPPGHYQLRTTVESAKMNKAGAVYLVCDVPDFNKAQVALSGLVIGFADPAQHSVGGTAVEHQLMRLEPVLERVFKASDALRLSFDVWRKNRADAVTTQLAIFDDAQRFVRQGVETVPMAANGHVDVKVPLAGLKPGPYVLAITATDRDKKDAREVGFFIK
jgi:VWFA-related protein